MSASGDDQPTRKRWRLVPIPVVTGVLAVIGAVVLAVFLSGCRGLSGGPGPAPSSRSAAPSTWSDVQGYRHRARRQGPAVGWRWIRAPTPSTSPTRRQHGVGDRRLDAHRHRHRARRPDPWGVAVDPGTHTVYVTNLDDDTVSVIDASTRTVTATVPVGKDPNGVAVDPGTHTVYVANDGDNAVSVIDGSTRTVTATVPVGKNPVGVAVDPGTHTVYVANGHASTVSVIDGSTRTVTATVPVGSFPNGVAVDPGTHTVYVTNSGPGPGSDTVSVIDGSTRTVTATLHVGSGPRKVAVDPGTHTVYVANGDTVSVIDGSRRAVTATVPVGSGGGGVAVDPGTHTVYVANNGDNTVSVIELSIVVCIGVWARRVGCRVVHLGRHADAVVPEVVVDRPLPGVPVGRFGGAGAVLAQRKAPPLCGPKGDSHSKRMLRCGGADKTPAH